MFDTHLENILNNKQRDFNDLLGLKIKFPIIKIIIFLFIFTSFILFFVIEIRSSNFKLNYFHTTNNVQATINHYEKDPFSSRCALIKYIINIDNNEFSGKGYISDDSPHCDLKQGDSINVRYINDDPSTNEIESELNNDARESFLVLAFFALLITIPFLTPRLREFLKNRNIFKKGELATATLIFITHNGDKNNFITPSILFFGFINDKGDKIEAQQICNNDWLVNQLKPNQKLHAMYLPKNPKKAFILETFIR